MLTSKRSNIVIQPPGDRGLLFFLDKYFGRYIVLVMKEKQKQNLAELAETLVTPERFTPPHVGRTILRLASLPHLPDNVFLIERESNYRLNDPPEAA